MKKILSCFVALFAAVSLYATDLNIYASGLKVTTSGGTTAGIQYTLNAPATSLNLKILNGASLVTTIAIPAGDANVNFTKGTHNVNIDITDLAEGSYNWAIEAIAEANNAVTRVPAEVANTYTLPRGLDVDKDPESPSFGNIYIADAIGTEASGLVAFYPATMSSRTTLTTSGWSASPASPMRVKVGEDHLLYITDWSDNYPNIHCVDPQSPTSSEYLIFGGTKSGTNGIYIDGEGHQIHGSISDCYVAGAGASRVLYTFDEDVTEGVVYSKALFRYDIGELSSPWASVPSAVVFDNAAHLEQNGNTVIQPDGRNGWWISQYRGTDGAAIPMLIHVSSTGVVNYNSSGTFTSYNRGGLGLNADKTQLASPGTGVIDVYNISWNEDVPSLTKAYTISTIANATSCYNVAFDYAGNIYATYDGYDIYAYAPVKADNSCETPAPSTSVIVRSSAVTHVTGISLDQTSASIEKGHTLTLVPTVVPGDATNPTVIWTSANSEIASVSNMGVVTAVAEGGPVTITATTQDGGFTATCEVTVFMNHVSSVTVEPNEIALGVGFKQQLTATILPADATNKTYTWSSDDESIATVANGMVTAVAVGSTTIKATAEDGGIVGSCNVVVSPAVAHISAYDLAVAPSATGYEFSFKANMATNVASLVFYDKANGNLVGDYPIANVVSGNNVVFVNSFALPGNGQDLTWGVRLVGADNAAFSLIYTSDEMTGRGHVVVDASPESPYMGQAYYTLRTGSATGGLYVFDQNYTRSEKYNLGQGKTGYMHPSIDETGKVWLSDWTDQDHSGIWIVDPSDLTTCTQVFQGTRQSSGLFKNGDVEVGGSSPACFVYGKGENRKLFTIQEDFTTMSAQPMAIYNIGSAYTWDAAPTAIYPVTNNTDFSNCLYVDEHGYWVSKNRGLGSNTPDYPALEFYGMDGTRLYESSGDANINGCLGAGFIIDPTHSKLYMADASSYILEFDLEYTGNVPSLTFVNKHYIGYSSVGSMSLDYAGNLYATVTTATSIKNTTPMRMVVYSPSTHGNNITIVPAPKASIVHMVPVAQLYEFDTQSGDWALNAGTAMTEKETNVFEGEFTFSGADRYITFSTTQGASAQDWTGIAGGRLSAVADGDNYWITGTSTSADFVMGGSKCYMVPAANAGKFHVTVNFNTMKVEFTKILADNIYEFDNATGSWNLGAGVVLTNVEDNVFEGEFTIAAEKNILFATANADNWGDLNAAQLHINAVNDYWVNGDCVAEISGNVNNSFLIKAAGKYRFHINLGTNTITITQLTAKVDVTSAGYATYFKGTKAYTMPTGMTGYVFNVANRLEQVYVAGDVVPAATPLVLGAAAGTYDLVFTTGGVAPTANSLLVGSDEAVMTNTLVSGDHIYYGLSLNSAGEASSVGFYWMAENGGAFENGAHKAFLAVPVLTYQQEFLAPARILFNENGATGIENVEGQEKAVKFIQNGQLYIQKNGVVYDAMGRVIR